MEQTEVPSLKRKLAAFLRRFYPSIKTRPSRQHFRTYVAGQLSDLERKPVAAIATEAGVPVRSLQEFLEIHRWDHAQMRTRLQAVIRQDYADDHAIGLIDETSFAKKGAKTAGVQPQYCGATGKRDNCVVTVHLGYVTEHFQALVDSELFLPEESWAGDRQRCRQAGIPDEVIYRPKWRIGLELLARTWQAGVRFRYLSADEEYGRGHLFRREVAGYGIHYVVEVPCDLQGWTKRPPVLPAGTPQGRRGRASTHPRLAPWAPAARRVDRLWKRGGPSWETFHVKDTAEGPVVWEVRATRFCPWEEGLPGEEQWLLIARQVLTGEYKYFLSNASVDTPLTEVLHIAFSRSHIEQWFETAKGQVGLDHFEVRQYQPLMRHLILSMVSLLFLEMQRQEVGEKNQGVVERPPDPAGVGDPTGWGAHADRSAA